MGIAAAGVLALYLAFGAYQIYDYDLPLHLITGEYLLRDPSSAGREIFAFPFPDYEWLNDKWLENVVVYLVDAAAGAPGLVALRMALLAGLCFLTAGAMGSGLGLRGPPKPGQAVIAAAGLAFLPFVAYERFNLRPELFSLLLVAAVLWLASRDRRTRGEWIAIGVLHVVWVNLHGYWIVGPIILGAFLAGDLIEAVTGRLGWPKESDPAEARARAVHRARLLGAALVGALISPHPIELFLNPFQVLLFVGEEGSIQTISEMRSPFGPRIRFNLAIGFFYAAAAATLAALAARPRRLRPAQILLAAGFFAMAAVSRRNIGMFAIVGAVVSVWSLAAPSARFNCDSFPRLRRASTATLVAIGLLSLWAAGCVVTDRFYVADGTSRRTGFSMSTLTFPRGVADFMLEVPVRGHFFNGFASGSYLAYRLYPEYQVFITGNTFKYPPEFFEDYTLVSMGGNEYKLLADEYGLTAFTMMYNSADMMPLAKRLFNDDDYTAVYFDDNAVLYVRNIPEMESIIEAHRVDFAAIARQRAAETPTPTNRAIPLVPTARRIYPRGELNRATFLFQVGLYQMAEIEYDRALKIDPTLEDVRHGLGDVILAQGRYEEAREILEPLAAGDPGSPHLHADLAKALSGIGSAAATARQWDEARRNLELALERIERSRRLDPDGDPQRPLEAADRFNLGFVLLQLAQQTGDATLEAEADRQFVAALEAQPVDDTLRYRVARVRVVQGRLEEAIDLLAEALAGGDPSLREQARHDRAWAPAYRDPRFRELVLQPADRP